MAFLCVASGIYDENIFYIVPRFSWHDSFFNEHHVIPNAVRNPESNPTSFRRKKKSR